MPRGVANANPLILTAILDRTAEGRFQHLRRAHYPSDRNLVPAHLTLFHHLPGTEAEEIKRRLVAVARGTAAMRAHAAGLRNPGRGVAIRIDCPALEDLRAELADAWSFWMIPQDRHFSPHVTIQNKVEPRAAKALYDALLADFEPWTFGVNGLTLWRYLGGPWEKVKDFRFRQVT